MKTPTPPRESPETTRLREEIGALRFMCDVLAINLEKCIPGSPLAADQKHHALLLLRKMKGLETPG
jgi:hypothetical protein